jgi:hypothetical protein
MMRRADMSHHGTTLSFIILQLTLREINCKQRTTQQTGAAHLEVQCNPSIREYPRLLLEQQLLEVKATKQMQL